MTEIPDWIEDKIEFNPQNNVQDRTVVEAFLDSDSPYMSSRQVAAKIGLTKEGARPRLEGLEEIGVLDADTVADARIFWIKDERSEWPIPTDVDVVPVQNEKTVSEFFNQLHVQYGLLAVCATMVGALLMMAFFLLLSSEVQIPVINTSDLLLGGVLFTLGGYMLVFLALGIGALSRFRQRGESSA